MWLLKLNKTQRLLRNFYVSGISKAHWIIWVILEMKHEQIFHLKVKEKYNQYIPCQGICNRHSPVYINESEYIMS